MDFREDRFSYSKDNHPIVVKTDDELKKLIEKAKADTKKLHEDVEKAQKKEGK